MGSATSDAAIESPACMISASNYDQSCTADSDCTLVSQGNYCDGKSCQCLNGAVNAGAVPRYAADIGKTPVGSGAVVALVCPCIPPIGPCCRSGACTTDCWSPSDTLPACADAGGLCSEPGISCGGMNGARDVPNSCAFPDEMCCF